MKMNWMKTAMVCGAAGLLVLGGTSAYLTDYEQAVNEFTVGKVEINLTEPEWKPEENQRIVPSQNIRKDPQITNVGRNEAFVYLQVAIPKAEVLTADEQGHRREKALTELFTFENNGSWTLLEEKDGETEKIYTYSYNEVLEAGQKTEALFESVTFANVIEGQLDTIELDIPIRAYAIQTSNTGGDAVDIVSQAREAYLKYVNQNAGQDGSVME